MVKRRGRGSLRRAYGAMLGAVCVGVTIYVGFCFLLGIDSYADGFQEKSGLYAQPVALEDLQAVTAYFAHQVSATAEGVARDEAGVFAEDRRNILENSVHAYDVLEEEYPFLAGPERSPKPALFSKLMSASNFTGYLFPFLGESTLNVDCPAVFIPVTVAHEFSHQRGVAQEEQANFVGIEACIACDKPSLCTPGTCSAICT